MTKIGQIKMILEASCGRFVGCTFIKMDGTERKMVFRNSGSAYTITTDKKGKQKVKLNLNSKAMLTVYDTRKKWYRKVNLNTITRLSVKGEVFNYD